MAYFNFRSIVTAVPHNPANTSVLFLLKSLKLTSSSSSNLQSSNRNEKATHKICCVITWTVVKYIKRAYFRQVHVRPFIGEALWTNARWLMVGRWFVLQEVSSDEDLNSLTLREGRGSKPRKRFGDVWRHRGTEAPSAHHPSSMNEHGRLKKGFPPRVREGTNQGRAASLRWSSVSKDDESLLAALKIRQVPLGHHGGVGGVSTDGE